MPNPYRELPNLQLLLSFEAVARLASFTGAAKELGITQSAVSHRMRALESHFGSLLLHRRSAGVELSDEGRLLLDAVRGGLSAMRHGCERVRRRQGRICESDAESAAQASDRGTVTEGVILHSQVLGRDVRCTVYTPAAYDRGQSRRFPVLYLLHAFPQGQDSESDFAWIQYGSADQVADAAVASGRAPPMILVMPDSGQRCWINNHDGSVRYEDMFVHELIAHIDQRYRTRNDRRFRGVAGFSMGGFGALTLAMRHPTQFSVCAALSPGLSTDDELAALSTETYATYFAQLLGAGLEGHERLTPHWYRHAPLHLASTSPVETLEAVAWYLDIGDNDPLYRASSLMHIILRDRRIAHEFRVRAGGHDWQCSSGALPDALAFVGAEFQRA